MSERRDCFVRCPSCEQVSAMPAGYLTLAVCERCGSGLPQRRQVVTIARRYPPGDRPPATPVSRLAVTDARAR